MGAQQVHETLSPEDRQTFTQSLLSDVEALEHLLAKGAFETGVYRIGAEQEVFLVDKEFHPAPVGPQILSHLLDPRLTTELARFNLEANLTPRLFAGSCFHDLEEELHEVLSLLAQGASKEGAQVLLTGILPTLRKSDLGLHNMTPYPRYARLNNAMSELRGAPFSVHIQGKDEVHLTHDNVMLEACNTSFQVHLQVDPAQFASMYNLSQALCAPVLAAAVNSPLLFGNRLWQETRVALFQHAVDARTEAERSRGQRPRVYFGDRYLDDSILELIRDDIARFRVVLANEPDEDPRQVLGRGEVPKLSALRLHTGTIWRWNRGCYGVHEGRPHLRIEHRTLPAGPTVVDEVANAALFLGLMIGLSWHLGPHRSIASLLRFDDIKGNLFAAARYGLSAQLTWFSGAVLPASTLLKEELLPLARQGLSLLNVDAADRDRYLGILEERVERGQTGARFLLDSAEGLSFAQTLEERDQLLTAALLARQKRGEPVATWPLVDPSDRLHLPTSGETTLLVSDCMSTDLFTARPDDPVDLAASVMQWRHVRHVPVEDSKGCLLGLLSHRDLLRAFQKAEKSSFVVRELMTPDPLTVTPKTQVALAIRLMRTHKVGCLPVVFEGKLVGILTEHDILVLAERLLSQKPGDQSR